ncbi:hypothetical protein V6N13_074946 [Hibiscus sabdariffa]|uniref:Uncharacterized protein n=1 Tax=Hibiscus sabdariffa TaxID=183260 RepID=A0ABR2U9Z6_9ROSI
MDLSLGRNGIGELNAASRSIEKEYMHDKVVTPIDGVEESGKNQLYIDWRRKPNAPDPETFAHSQRCRISSTSLSWSGGMESTCCLKATSLLHRLNYNIYPYNHHHQQ